MKKAILILVSICIIKVADAQQYNIKANVTGFANGTKFYLEDVDVSSNIDSASIKDNQFELKGNLQNVPKELYLTARVGQKFYYTVLLIGNENINIKGDIKDFPFQLSITGSKSQDDYNKLFSLLGPYFKLRNELGKKSIELNGDSAEIKKEALNKTSKKIDSAIYKITMDFIASHHNSYAGLMALFDKRQFFSKDSIQHIYNSLKFEFKNSNYGQRIATYTKVGNILKEGDQFTNFEGIDKYGQTHALSDVKGKYILVDFSATYCGPCMSSLRDLKNISKNHADKVEIISFSADGGKALWLEGVKRDNPAWLSLWDGKGAYGETFLKYGIYGYPTFVLIDPQGKIISEMVGYFTIGSKGNIETKVDQVMAQDKQP